MTSNLDLNLLRAFDALMRYESVTAAAAELGLTQSSTSNALDRLRKALGDRILERRGNRMIPTRVAVALWPEIAAALGTIEAALAATRAFDPGSASGTFRVGMDAYATAFAGVRLAAVVAREAPAMRLEILPVSHPDEETPLNQGRLDLFIGSAWRPLASIVSATLFPEDFVAVVAPGHPLAQGSADLETYLAHDHILTSPRGSVAGNVDAALEALGHRRHVSLVCPTFDTSARAAAEGLGIFTCGRRLAEIYTREFDLRAMELPLSVPGFSLTMEWMRRNSNAADLAWLRSRILDVLR
ncbi:LysR family transcriptional regulator [Ciceribacter sp. L1K23]|uniref:LysR family transcriptional regulator n=1 Tax=Ciceribacter sp. L1K23 TaxID=2820276 RepID=UPI001B82F0B6|nr:LysR family transcriptional regulator [Ciceribacter sp. L1K23]